MLLHCTKCNEDKEDILFKKTNQRITGYSSWCKLCHSAETCKTVDRKKANMNNKAYKKTEKGKLTDARYKAWRVWKHGHARPSWANREAMKRIYAEARRLGLEVDHIVPLVSKFVCGLHWESNLQLLSPYENKKKSNLHWPDMYENAT